MGRDSVAAYATFVALASFSVGYWVGTRSNAKPTPPPVSPNLPPNIQETNESDSDGNESDDSDHSSADDGDISSVRVDATENCKLVLVVRTDLGMTSGKIAAQHATLACYKTLLSKNPVMLRQWERDGQTKVALRCEDEDELLLMQAQAQSLNLCARSIQDAGRTQIAAGSRTVLGIAGPARLVNQITGKLRLL